LGGIAPRVGRWTKAVALEARVYHIPAMGRTREFNVIIERDSEGYFVASVPELRGCHTQAKSLDILMKRIREAIELCLEVEKDIYESPDFVGVQHIAVAV
jgi:predicted RNase H-like HicB family nuclease